MKTSEKIRQLRIAKGLSQEELGELVGVKKAAINKYETGRVVNIKRSVLQKLGDVLGVSPADLLDDEEKPSGSTRINIYGSIPAGIPIEAISDVIGWEDISPSMLDGGKEYFGLRVKGDSMEPKYLDGDIIIVQKQPFCESGDDCVVYVNGYDATLKKVIKKRDCIVIQPLNMKYEPKVYDYNDERNPVTIAGVVREIRRKV